MHNRTFYWLTQQWRFWLYVAVSCLQTMGFAQPLIAVNSVVLDQPLNDITYDTTRQQLLLTIPSTDLQYGNSVGFFDPVTLTMDTFIFVGSEPGPMDLTDNGQYAYVGTDGSGTVKKLDLNTFEIVSSTHMGYDFGGDAQKASRISCQPGNDAVFAVVKVDAIGSSSPTTIDVYENGMSVYGSSSGPRCDQIRFKPNAPDRLVGTEHEGSVDRFWTIAVLPGEVDPINATNTFFDGPEGGLSVFGDLALTDRGTVIDISADVPVLLGNCTVPAGVSNSAACVDHYQGRICIAFRSPSNSSTLRVVRFDMNTFEAVDQFDVPLTSSVQHIHEVLCWGPGTRYAIHVDDDELVIVNGEVVPTAAPAALHTVDAPRLVQDGNELRAQCDGPVDLQMWDIQGRLIASSAANGRISLATVATGTYVVRFISAGRALGAQKWTFGGMSSTRY